MSDFRIEVFGLTDVGLQREKNEDNFAVHEDAELFILADGMGGHNSGQVASHLAVEHVTKFLLETRFDESVAWPYPTRDDRTFDENSMDVALKYANERIFVESMKKAELEGMGTTLLGAMSSENKLVFGHVGDSRVYRFANGRLTQVTEDHSLLNHMIKTKQLDPSKAKDFKNKNIIVRAVGLKDYVEVDVVTVTKHHDDVFLMCSDGLTDLVEDWIITEVLQGEEKLPEKAQTLVRLANQSGGKDNITVILFHVKDQRVQQERSMPVLKPVEMLEKKRTREMELQKIEARIKAEPKKQFNDITAHVNLEDLALEGLELDLDDTLHEDEEPELEPELEDDGAAGVELGDAFEQELLNVSNVGELTDPGTADDDIFDFGANQAFTLSEKRKLSKPSRFIRSIDELMYLEAVIGGVVIPELFE